MGARLLRQWVLSPLRERGGHQRRGSTPSRSWCRTAAREAGSARRSMACATSSASPGAPPPGAPRRANSAPCAIRFARLPDVLERLTGLADAGPAQPPWARLVDGVRPAAATSPSALRGALTDRPPAALADGGRHPPRLRRRARRTARTSATAASSTSPRSSSGSGSAPASPRSRSATTRCSATSSRSPTRTGRGCPPTTSAGRR